MGTACGGCSCRLVRFVKECIYSKIICMVDFCFDPDIGIYLAIVNTDFFSSFFYVHYFSPTSGDPGSWALII